MCPFRLYLASASPRRLQLLRQVGLVPLVRPALLDERAAHGEPPATLVRRLAESKGRAVVQEIAGEGSRRGTGLILAADTAVVVAGEVLGKPTDPADAEQMLRRLRGRTHEVLTGVFLLRIDDGRSACEVESTRVTFGELGDETIRAYVAGGEPLDKAGAYGLQGRGALFVERIEGSWSNVVGLPVERLPAWSARIGIDLLGRVSWGVGA